MPRLRVRQSAFPKPSSEALLLEALNTTLQQAIEIKAPSSVIERLSNLCAMAQLPKKSVITLDIQCLINDFQALLYLFNNAPSKADTIDDNSIRAKDFCSQRVRDAWRESLRVADEV